MTFDELVEKVRKIAAGKLKVDGDVGKALEFSKLINNVTGLIATYIIKT